MRAAIYARVSKERCNLCGYTKDQHPNKSCQAYQGQDPENQLRELRQYSKRQNWELVREFIDLETGKHSDRAQMQALFEAATRRQFDVVLVWALDRFTREGVSETFLHIRKLLDYGVQFESFTESHFRTTGPAGELMIAIAAWIAKQERIRISERTKAGLARARAAGKVGGRPARVFDRLKALEMRHKQGMSWRAIAREMGIAQSSIRKALKMMESKGLKGVHKTPPVEASTGKRNKRPA